VYNRALELMPSIIQDSVLWRMEFPGHPIFQDPIFQTPEYRAFELQVRGALAIAVEQDPHTIAIQKAIPAVNDRLRTMTGVIQNGQATHAEALGSLEELLITRMEGLTSALTEFLGGSFHFVPRGQLLAPALPAGPVTGPVPLTAASSLPNRPVAPPVTTLARAAEEVLPQYRMSRTVQTIPELWQEWTVGLQGQPSIERLDELYGSRWRSGPASVSERQFYSRRKTLITEIRRLAAAVRDPPDEEAYHRVVLQLEDERIRARASLSKVIHTLKKAQV
jgi:Transcriptional activator of glycolytic enzymes